MGMESNRMDFAGVGDNGKDCTKCIVRSICLTVRDKTFQMIFEVEPFFE